MNGFDQMVLTNIELYNQLFTLADDHTWKFILIRNTAGIRLEFSVRNLIEITVPPNSIVKLESGITLNHAMIRDHMWEQSDNVPYENVHFDYNLLGRGSKREIQMCIINDNKYHVKINADEWIGTCRIRLGEKIERRRRLCNSCMERRQESPGQTLASLLETHDHITLAQFADFSRQCESILAQRAALSGTECFRCGNTGHAPTDCPYVVHDNQENDNNIVLRKDL